MKASSAASPLRQRFIRELRLRGFSSRTVESYVSWVYDLARHHHKSPDQLSDEHLKDYLLYLHQERSLTNNTIRVAVNALRSFYTLVQGLLSVGAVDVRARAFLATVYSAGLRLNEACHLRVRDVLRDRRQIRVEQGKGNKDRYTILADGLLPILREYYRVYRPQQWLFPSRQSQERPILDATGQRMYEQALARAQLPHRGGIHSLRHSFSTHLLESGVEVTVLQRLLGHRSIHSTLRYLHLRSERLQQIKSPLDRALEPKQPRVKSPKEHAPSLTPQ
jgi:integrase/recombinase XerD